MIHFVYICYAFILLFPLNVIFLFFFFFFFLLFILSFCFPIHKQRATLKEGLWFQSFKRTDFFDWMDVGFPGLMRILKRQSSMITVQVVA